MEENVETLKFRAQVFHKLLEKYAPVDSDAASLLGWLAPLFRKVELGLISPPYHYDFRMALGKESNFFDRHIDVRSAESNFMSALEGWETQDWYRNLKND